MLDGLLYHETDLNIEEHYTDTAGFTDHVFALMHLLGFRFAPRIRDLADKRLCVPDKQTEYSAMSSMVRQEMHWHEQSFLIDSVKFEIEALRVNVIEQAVLTWLLLQ